MHVSIWMIILWLLIFTITIKSFFRKHSHRSQVVKKDMDEGLKGCVFWVKFFVVILLAIINVWYFIATAMEIGSTHFALLSAAMAIHTLYCIGPVLQRLAKWFNQEDLEEIKRRFTVIRLLKMCHLIYFGFYIVAGKSLLSMIW